MARVILVRHAESESNRGGGLDGGQNSPLSRRGRAQAAAAGRAFAGFDARGAALLTSPLDRAVDTAAAIGAAIGAAPIADVRLSAGETWAARALDLDDPATLPVVGEMVLAALAERIDAGAATIVAVSHRYPIWALLVRLMGDRGTALMDALDNLANGDQLELFLAGDAVVGAPIHRPLRG